MTLSRALRMTLSRALVLALALSAGIAGCSEKPESAAPAREAAPSPADGAPRIANSADGVHIEYRVYGRGDPAVVLVHCWSCDSNYWRQQIPQLSSRYTVVTVDLAGHGASGRNRTQWTIEGFGDDVAAVVRQIRNRDVVLVGHGMGGPVALEAVRHIGDRVIGIIGVDTFKTAGLPPVPPADLEKQLAAFRTDFIGNTRRYVSQSLFPPNADPALVRKTADDLSLAPPEIAIASIAALNAMDLDGLLSQMRIPIVAINSEHGGRTDEERIRAIAPGFRAVVLQGTGHFPMLEDPERFTAVLLEQLGELTGPNRD